MIEVATQRGKALRIARAGADARDLQRLIPIRTENENSHYERAVLLLLSFDPRHWQQNQILRLNLSFRVIQTESRVCCQWTVVS